MVYQKSELFSSFKDRCCLSDDSHQWVNSILINHPKNMATKFQNLARIFSKNKKKNTELQPTNENVYLHYLCCLQPVVLRDHRFLTDPQPTTTIPLLAQQSALISILIHQKSLKEVLQEPAKPREPTREHVVGGRTMSSKSEELRSFIHLWHSALSWSVDSQVVNMPQMTGTI